MSVVKEYSSSPAFRRAVEKNLRLHTPADLLFNFGEVLYDLYVKAMTRKEKNFYLAAGRRLIHTVRDIKILERKS